jgi:hypothetical protein
MKIILLLAIPFLLTDQIYSETTILCKGSRPGFSTCTFRDVIIEKNETISIEVYPPYVDANGIVFVEFYSCSIHYLPSEIFTKFPNAEFLYAVGLNIQEIKPDTFQNATKLKLIDLKNNELTKLHHDTFKGENF